MASYPGAVVSFPTRTNGQTIDASHINTLQDEVTAIESGLLNGTAPLTASNTILAGLDVNGNSTLASTITIGSQTYIFPSSAAASTGMALTAITISGSTHTLELRSPTPAVVTPFIVRLTHTSTQTVSSAAPISLLWDSEDLTSTRLHSTASASSNIKLVSSGWWQLGFNVTFAGGSSSPTRSVKFILNDTSVYSSVTASVGGTPSAGAVNGQTLYHATDTTVTVGLRVRDNQGGGASISSLAAFWARQLST